MLEMEHFCFAHTQTQNYCHRLTAAVVVAHMGQLPNKAIDAIKTQGTIKLKK